ncbi:MAG: Ig-like domain-containing protein, partial [Planctomycetes bacterium]|nr:Ig-like domain-containing protein [Planctomycetota bacterium]
MRTIRWTAAAALAFVLSACTGGGSGGSGGDFLVLRTTPPNNGRLYLNEPIRIDFSTAVDLTSADLNTVSFQVFDQNGDALTERPAGTFSLSATAGDASVGRQLVFTPLFPTNNTYDNGGFRPGRTYVVQLVGGDRRNNTVLRDTNGRALAQAVSFTFQTADGTTPSQLFSDTRAGGPRMTSIQISPRDANGVALNKVGREPVEIRLNFDQPLNPADDNVPVGVSADPLVRVSADRGRISLEYTDPAAPTPPTWFPATVELERNTREGSTVVLRPIGVLPNNALVSVIVESSVEDMAGESNVQNAAYDQIVATFSTRQDFEPQYDSIVEEFGASSAMDLEAAFLEPTATLASGKLTASFAFDGG